MRTSCIASSVLGNRTKTTITGLLIFRAVTELRNSGKSAKSCEIHKNTKNTAKFGRNLIKYMLVQHICYRGYLLAINLQIYLRTSSLKGANTRRRLCCEKLGTSHDVKGLAIGSFLECTVGERANADLC